MAELVETRPDGDVGFHSWRRDETSTLADPPRESLLARGEKRKQETDGKSWTSCGGSRGRSGQRSVSSAAFRRELETDRQTRLQATGTSGEVERGVGIAKILMRQAVIEFSWQGETNRYHRLVYLVQLQVENGSGISCGDHRI